MNLYDFDAHVAEYYDQSQVDTADVDLIRRLIAGRRGLRILEPFCGTGRILIPLAQDGHTLVGIDQARVMLERAQAKIDRLEAEVRGRIRLLHADATASDWPGGFDGVGFDLVILGGNCFYELPGPEGQEGCIRRAAASLVPGGHVYVDNDHMEGDLDKTWQRPIVQPSFPTGLCMDGSRLESTIQTIRYDVPHRAVWFRRWTRLTRPDGGVLERDVLQRKHPVSAGEVRSWLEKHGFTILCQLGDRAGSDYKPDSPRAIFWARKG